MDVIGFLKAKKDTRQATETFRVREFVVTIEADSQYPQHISMQVTQDRCDLLDQFNEGDQLKVNFNLAFSCQSLSFNIIRISFL